MSWLKGKPFSASHRKKLGAVTRKRWGNQTPAERFWSKVAKRRPNQCWLWTASTQPKKNGEYGQIYWRGRPVQASRVSWELANGRRPGKKHVLHTCDVPLCVNPRHLVIGTPLDNSRDMWSKGRGAQGEKHYAAKLTVKKVREIRRRFAAGERLFQLAKIYGVNRMVIKNVVVRNTWKHA